MNLVKEYGIPMRSGACCVAAISNRDLRSGLLPNKRGKTNKLPPRSLPRDLAARAARGLRLRGRGCSKMQLGLGEGKRRERNRHRPYYLFLILYIKIMNAFFSYISLSLQFILYAPSYFNLPHIPSIFADNLLLKEFYFSKVK